LLTGCLKKKKSIIFSFVTLTSLFFEQKLKNENLELLIVECPFLHLFFTEIIRVSFKKKKLIVWLNSNQKLSVLVLIHIYIKKKL